MTAMPTPPPPLSSRLGDVQSSPVRDILELTQRAGVISFAGGLPAPELFPAELIAGAFARALAPTVAARALQYSATDGDPQLRELLAERFTARGLATRGRRRPRDDGIRSRRSASSRPCWWIPATSCSSRTPRIWRRCSASASRARRSCRSIATSAGLDPEALPALIARHAPKFLYVVPTFQNPTGRTLPSARRARLAADRRRARPLDRRGRPLRRAALRRRGARADRLPSRRRRSHDHDLLAVEGARAGAADRLGARARRRSSGR